MSELESVRRGLSAVALGELPRPAASTLESESAARGCCEQADQLDQSQLLLEDVLFSCVSCGAGSVRSESSTTGTRAAALDLRLLSCLHSVCRSCLTSSCVRGDGTAVCPSCMEVTHLQVVGWIDALPRNYWTLARAKSHAGGDKAKASLQCGECAEADDGEVAEAVVGACLDCNELLCALHWLAHQKGRRTKHHRVTDDLDNVSATTQDGESVRVEVQRSASGVPCAMHPGHDVIGLCKTCNQMVCEVCLERSHSQHLVDRQFQSATDERSDMEKEMEKSDRGIEACEASIAELNAVIDNVNLEVEKASEEVSTSVQRLIDELRKEEKQALFDIDKARWSLQKELEKRVEQKKTAKSQLQRARFLVQASLAGGTCIKDAQFLHVSGPLRRNLDEGNTECGRAVDLSDLPKADSVHEAGEAFTNTLHLLCCKLQCKGSFTANPVDDQCPWQLEPYEDDIPAIHQLTWRHVKLASSPRASYASTGKLRAVIQCPSGEIDPCEFCACTCTDKDEAASKAERGSGDGHTCMDLYFSVKMPGEHLLHVTHNGGHVHGSPSKITVAGYPLGEEDRIRDEKYIYVSAAIYSYPLKWGVYIPKVPQKQAARRKCALGVQLYFAKSGAREEESISVCHYFCDASGVFRSTSIEEGARCTPDAVDGCVQVWEDEEVMQVEFSIIKKAKWRLHLTYLRSGATSTATGPLHSPNMCWPPRAFVDYPTNSPAYLLPAFF